MNLAWLNRIGIILNFLAGFMVAPELIGLERINKFEQYIEDRIELTKSSINRFLSENPLSFELEWLQRNLFKSMLLSLTLICLSSVFWLIINSQLLVKVNSLIIASLLLLFILIIPLIPVLLLAVQTRNDSLAVKQGRSVELVVSVPFKLFVLINGVFIWGILLGLFLFLVYVIPQIIDSLLGTILRILSGNERMQSLLVAWGIVFFIVGNLFQLIATFEK